MITEFKKRPVSINSEISDAIFTEAGRLKATYKIAIVTPEAIAEGAAVGYFLFLIFFQMESVIAFF